MLAGWLAVLLAAVGASVAALDAAEKHYVPWPTSLKDSNKVYTTLTLPDATLTAHETTSTTVRVVKTVYSFTTTVTTSIVDTTLTTTETATVNLLATKTFSSVLTERATRTLWADETLTVTQTTTETLDGTDATDRPIPAKAIWATTTKQIRSTLTQFVTTTQALQFRETVSATLTATRTLVSTRSIVYVQATSLTHTSRILVRNTFLTTTTIGR